MNAHLRWPGDAQCQRPSGHLVIRSVTVVGASLAGVSTARALRAQGFDGGIVLVGDEPHAPYDRPPLSKGFLTAPAEPSPDPLVQDDEDLDVEWRLGVRAVALEPATRTVVLDDGARLPADAVVLATGARARRLPGTGHLDGVHTLRTLDDARALRAQLAGGGSLVVVGGGFIGAEVASSARSLGLDVTVVEALRTPLAGPLGTAMGAAVAGLHDDHGVRLRTGLGVRRLHGATRVEAVELADGTRLPADAVVVGIGAEPETAWLRSSGLDVDGGVRTDATCATAAPGIVAVGDCGLAYDVHAGRHLRAEHWTHALQQPATAAATLLGAPAPYTAVPYVWSEQYGLHVQLAGWTAGADEPVVVHGSVEQRSFVATYERAGALVAVLGVGAPGPFTKWRKALRTAAAARLAA
jgi:NADPH-dependent 2,4-dienoyl-CoA reductase/sulfur reductase-like enzyme